MNEMVILFKHDQIVIIIIIIIINNWINEVLFGKGTK